MFVRNWWDLMMRCMLSVVLYPDLPGVVVVVIRSFKDDISPCDCRRVMTLFACRVSRWEAFED